MRLIDVACRHTQGDGWNCGAEAGEVCTAVDTDGRRAPLADGMFHPERIEDAAGIGGGCGEEPTVEAFDRAVEASGLV